MSYVADAPRLNLPNEAREPCGVTVLEGETQADLEIAYRQRGVDVSACNVWRALAVQTLDEEHRLEDGQKAARAARNSRFCRWLRLGCNG